jgi:hypothetical protein
MLKTTKVSDSKIKVVVNPDYTILAKGHDWFPKVYSNIFHLGKKHSGKSIVIENELEKCAGKRTKFIFIVSTINRDSTWKRIVKKWEAKGHDVLVYDDLYDNTDEGKINVIQEFLDEQKELAAEELELENKIEEDKLKKEKMKGKGSVEVIERPKGRISYCDANGVYHGVDPKLLKGGSNAPKSELKEELPPPAIETKKKKKLIYPQYIIVIDDMGAAMRDKNITQLLKTNRHYKTKVILSGQNFNDLEPAAIRQLDYCLVFGKVPDDKMEKLHEDLDLSLPFDKFLELYKDATSTPYQFLYIGREPDKDIYRKGFNEQYDIDQ